MRINEACGFAAMFVGLFLLIGCSARAEVSDQAVQCVIDFLAKQPRTARSRPEGEWVLPAYTVGDTKVTKVNKVIYHEYRDTDKNQNGIYIMLIMLSEGSRGLEISTIAPLRYWPNNMTLRSFLSRDSKDNPLYGAFAELESKCHVTYSGGRPQSAHQ